MTIQTLNQGSFYITETSSWSTTKDEALKMAASAEDAEVMAHLFRLDRGAIDSSD
jgi:hypothetical protein